MPLVMRRIHQLRWIKQEIEPWLERGEVPADPFADFKTDENALSVWLIDDDRSNLERVVTALACLRDKFDKFDYLLFDQQVLSQANLTVRESAGPTPDVEVNLHHRDLVDLSGNHLLALIEGILNSEYETDRILREGTKELVTEAVRSGRIELIKLNRKLQGRIAGDDSFPRDRNA